jgi:hypothetical protein
LAHLSAPQPRLAGPSHFLYCGSIAADEEWGRVLHNRTGLGLRVDHPLNAVPMLEPENSSYGDGAQDNDDANE